MARRDDDESAPWLAEAGTPRTNVSKRSLFWTLLIGLGLAVVIAVGLVLLLSKKDAGSTQGYMNAEQAPLITAVPGPYKVAPVDPKGLDVEGQDQTIYAAGEGIDSGSVIDQSAMPEAPLPRPGTEPPPGLPTDLLSDVAATPANPAPAPVKPIATAPPATTKPVVTPAPTTAKPVATPAPTTAKPAQTPAKPLATPAPTPAPATTKPPATPAKTSGTVQLGAFSTPEKAHEAWAKLAGKHGLSGKRIVPVETNGKTLYRLRASGDSAATCAKLKAAGDPCSVVE